MNNDPFKPILIKRIGLIVSWGIGSLYKTDWPFGKLMLYKDHLIVQGPFKKFNIKIADIDRIKKRLIGINIVHHSPENPKDISIYGPFVFRSIKRKILKNALNISLRS